MESYRGARTALIVGTGMAALDLARPKGRAVLLLIRSLLEQLDSLTGNGQATGPPVGSSHGYLVPHA
jgi:hypothetical protein